jgi:hypothetical protein
LARQNGWYVQHMSWGGRSLLYSGGLCGFPHGQMLASEVVLESGKLSSSCWSSACWRRSDDEPLSIFFLLSPLFSLISSGLMSTLKGALLFYFCIKFGSHYFNSCLFCFESFFESILFINFILQYLVSFSFYIKFDFYSFDCFLFWILFLIDFLKKISTLDIWINLFLC